MACSKQTSLFLLGLHASLVLVLLMAVGPAPADALKAHLHFFMHDVFLGPNATVVQVANGTVPLPNAPSLHFGDTYVIDDLLTQDASPSSAPVGRTQGFYMIASLNEPALLVSMNVVLTAGPYNGSTVTVMGRDDVPAPVRELSVVGGTGRFRMARGYVLWKTWSQDGDAKAVLELDVFVRA